MRHGYEPSTEWEKMVADYLRISLFDVQELEYLYYLQIRRDSFIYALSRSEGGINYLNEAWRLSRTEPDREASRRMVR